MDDQELLRLVEEDEARTSSRVVWNQVLADVAASARKHCELMNAERGAVAGAVSRLPRVERLSSPYLPPLRTPSRV